MRKKIRITESEIKSTIQRVLNEAFKKWGGGYGGGYQKKSPGVKGARQGYIQISRCKTVTKPDPSTGEDVEYIAIQLGHIYTDGARDLVTAINNAVPQDVMQAKLNLGGGDRVILYVKAEDKGQINSVVPQLRDAIVSVHDYNEKSIDTLCDVIFDRADRVITSKDKENAEKSKIGNWKDMLKRLQDPDVRMRLLTYQTTSNYGQLYGHVLSQRNIKSILDQKPDASFVTTPNKWARDWNRSIKPGATRLVVSIPLRREGAQAMKDRIAQNMGYANFNAARKLSRQIANTIEYKAQQGLAGFDDILMIDVSDTIPNDPNNDRWTTEIGLNNNLTGELNAAAADYDAKLKGGDVKNDEDKAKIDKMEQKIAAANAEANKKRREIMQDMCKKLGLDTSPFDQYDEDAFIARAVYHIAKMQASQYNVIKPDLVERLAVQCAAVVCGVFDLDFSKSGINRSSSYFANISDEDAMNVYNITDKIIYRLSAAGRVVVDDNDRIVNPNKTDESYNRRMKKINERNENGMTIDDLIRNAKNRHPGLYVGMNDFEEENSMAFESLRNKIGKIVAEEINRTMRNKRKY